MEYELLNDIVHNRGMKMERVGKTCYKYVYIVSYDGIKTYTAELQKYKFYKCFADIRDAAKAVDIELLKHGKEAVNILKRKS